MVVSPSCSVLFSLLRSDTVLGLDSSLFLPLFLHYPDKKDGGSGSGSSSGSGSGSGEEGDDHEGDEEEGEGDEEAEGQREKKAGGGLAGEVAANAVSLAWLSAQLMLRGYCRKPRLRPRSGPRTRRRPRAARRSRNPRLLLELAAGVAEEVVAAAVGVPRCAVSSDQAWIRCVVCPAVWQAAEDGSAMQT